MSERSPRRAARTFIARSSSAEAIVTRIALALTLGEIRARLIVQPGARQAELASGSPSLLQNSRVRLPTASTSRVAGRASNPSTIAAPPNTNTSAANPLRRRRTSRSLSARSNNSRVSSGSPVTPPPGHRDGERSHGDETKPANAPTPMAEQKAPPIKSNPTTPGPPPSPSPGPPVLPVSSDRKLPVQARCRVQPACQHVVNTAWVIAPLPVDIAC